MLAVHHRVTDGSSSAERGREWRQGLPALSDGTIVLRLETRAVEANGRGNGVVRKLGATREGVLRGGFKNGDAVSNHVMWSILAPEWRALRSRARMTT